MSSPAPGAPGEILQAQIDDVLAAEQQSCQVLELALPPEIAQALEQRRVLGADEIAVAIARVKESVQSRQSLDVLFDYPHLPRMLIRTPDPVRSQLLLADPEIVAIRQPAKMNTQISATASANQMQADLMEALGSAGAGTSVLVTDSGLGPDPPDEIHPDFGACSAVGVPAATCQLASYTVSDATGGNGHGTNVAAIVARTARQARVHFFDVGGPGTSISAQLGMLALNWAIQNRDTYNIVAHNMSWGGFSSCDTDTTTFATATAAGIAQVAASGNNSLTTQMLHPACNPYVISVGNLNTTMPGWEVNPSSNVSPELDFLAPGTWIDAGGFEYQGTSQASPHVAGAIAVLQAADAWNRLDIATLVGVMKSSGTWVADTRAGVNQSFPFPRMHDARARRLVIDNPEVGAFALNPAPMNSCGSNCNLYAGGNVTMTLPPGYLFNSCRPGAPGTCSVDLDADVRGRFFTPGSLLTILHALPTVPLVPPPDLTCTFNVTIPDTPWTADLLPSERQLITRHVMEAGRRWVERLVLGSPCSIEVRFLLDPDIATANGRSLTSVQVGTVNGRPMYEQGVAHELRTGNDPNGVDPDMEINLGFAYFWDQVWLDPQPDERIAAIPKNRVDGLSVFLHEFGHALAYNGWADGQGHPPEGFWSYFDRWILPGTPPLFNGLRSVAAWGSQPDLTLNNVFHWGNAPFTMSSPGRVQEPVTWKDGRPVPRLSHDAWQTVEAPPATHAPGQGGPPGLIDQLMNGVVFYYQHRYDISDLDRAALEDVGLEFVDGDIFTDGFEN